MSARDLIGQRFGRLSVIACHGVTRRFTVWACLCDCGAQRNVREDNLLAGHSKSCGCLSREFSAHRARKHGGRRTREYQIWQGMLSRCRNPNVHNYSRYGGAGIFVHAPWAASFEAFLADVGPAPTNAHSIDRFPDQRGNYEPGNVRWATATQQGRNRTNNRLLTIDGETLPMSEWAARAGLLRSTAWARLRAGWSERDALTRPSRQRTAA